MPRKKSFRKNLGRVNPNCIKQNSLSSEFKKIIPRGMKHIEDNVFGVDFEYNGITIDQKFSFGDLGNNTIKIRIKNRELVNKSDWTLCINEIGEIELFPTYKLAEFVKRNWGIVAKGRIEQKKDYVTYKINLNDFYRVENIVCFKTSINESEVFSTLNEICEINYQERYENKFKENNFTIIDNQNRFGVYPNSLNLH